MVNINKKKLSIVYKKKISGRKNELSSDEIKYFETILTGYKYNNKQLGITGASTSAYLFVDGLEKQYALKIPNNSNDNSWNKSQLQLENKINKYINGYDGNVKTPEIIEQGNNYALEKFLGVDFTEDVYNSLTEEERNKLAKDFAGFLVSAHKKSIQKGKIFDFKEYKKLPFEKIVGYFKPFLSQDRLEKITSRIKKFENRDTSDEITVQVHGDIRSQNVLYNEEDKQLALIDFESSREDNIYRDFVPRAAASFNISYEFWNNVVDEYNNLSNIKIDKEKVKLLHQLGILHEYTRCSILSRKNMTSDEMIKLYDRIEKKVNQVEEAFVVSKKYTFVEDLRSKLNDSNVKLESNIAKKGKTENEITL